MPQKILIIDDEKSILESLSGILDDEGFSAVCADNAEQGLEILADQQIDLVLLDIWLPGMDGMEALRQIKIDFPHLPVIMISGHGTIETAVQATRHGAYDFIEKPLSYDKIVLAIQNGLHLFKVEEENQILRQKSSRKPDLTGDSEPIRNLRDEISRVAPTEASVLIQGEHGTGKEVVAQTLHRLSNRGHKPMIELNCAAIPEELIESELFGHEKGSFTGASSDKRGKFDLANNGTLFLDEIADMSLKTQAKILRILQEQTFERVGGNKTITVDVRVLAASNKNLEEEIEQGNFRADLFWRLNVVPITVPPLRHRVDDIPALTEDFIRELTHKGLGTKKISAAALKIMRSHDWPGNVRELRNITERLVIMSPEKEISAETVSLFLKPTRKQAVSSGNDESIPFSFADFKEARREFEKIYLRNRLRENNNNISQTAEAIGMERSHLNKKIKALGIEQ